jgi:hypothetical protein
MGRGKGNVKPSSCPWSIKLFAALAAVWASGYGCTTGTSKCLNPHPLPPSCEDNEYNSGLPSEADAATQEPNGNAGSSGASSGSGLSSSADAAVEGDAGGAFGGLTDAGALISAEDGASATTPLESDASMDATGDADAQSAGDAQSVGDAPSVGDAHGVMDGSEQ